MHCDEPALLVITHTAQSIRHMRTFHARTLHIRLTINVNATLSMNDQCTANVHRFRWCDDDGAVRCDDAVRINAKSRRGGLLIRGIEDHSLEKKQLRK